MLYSLNFDKEPVKLERKEDILRLEQNYNAVISADKWTFKLLTNPNGNLIRGLSLI
jgi:hypothetical protein